MTKGKKSKDKIQIKIKSKNGIIQKRTINKTNKFKYDYNKKLKSYSKKSTVEIKKIRWVEKSKKQEKKLKKESEKEIEKKKEEFTTKKRKKPVELKGKGHYTTMFEFVCKVSDTIINHCYAVRTEFEDTVLEFHNIDYHDHTVMNYNLHKRKFIEDK